MKRPSPPWTLTLSALALAALLPGCGKTDAKPAEPRAAMTITSTPVKTETWPQTLEAQGAVAAWQEAQIAARVSGLPLLTLEANVGDRVKRGQVLARFDDRSVRADVAVAEATLASARATLRQQAANRDRALQVKGAGVISEQDLLQAQTQADAAAAQVDLAAAQLATQRIRLADCEVRAVDDGVISARSATLGQVSQVGAELFRLIRRERLEWRAELTAEQMAQVAVGQEATLTLPDGKTLSGKVRQLAPSLDGSSRLGLAYVDLPPGSTAKAGSYTSGRIALAQQPALTVPAEAVVLRDGRSSVFRVTGSDKDTKVTQVAVTTGRRAQGAVELTQGVKAGEPVAVRGAGFLNDGDRVRVTPEAAK